MKYLGILKEDEALAAVTQDGDALRYVLCKDLFIKTAGILKIKIEL